MKGNFLFVFIFKVLSHFLNLFNLVEDPSLHLLLVDNYIFVNFRMIFINCKLKSLIKKT